MGLFDRVRAFAQRSSPAPEGAAKAPSRSAKGRSGTVNVGGFISDDEMNVLLRWPQNLQVYDEMRRTDSMVRWMLGLAKYPMLATPKSIEPASQEPEHLEHAAFVEHVFFGGELDGGFNEFLRQALTFFEFGHSLFERIADLREVSFSYREPRDPDNPTEEPTSTRSPARPSCWRSWPPASSARSRSGTRRTRTRRCSHRSSSSLATGSSRPR
jgi:hypothetical protein